MTSDEQVKPGDTITTERKTLIDWSTPDPELPEWGPNIMPSVWGNGLVKFWAHASPMLTDDGRSGWAAMIATFQEGVELSTQVLYVAPEEAEMVAGMLLNAAARARYLATVGFPRNVIDPAPGLMPSGILIDQNPEDRWVDDETRVKALARVIKTRSVSDEDLAILTRLLVDLWGD